MNWQQFYISIQCEWRDAGGGHSVIGEEADMSNEVERCRGREEERNIQCTSFLTITEHYRTEFHAPVSRGSCHSVGWPPI